MFMEELEAVLREGEALIPSLMHMYMDHRDALRLTLVLVQGGGGCSSHFLPELLYHMANHDGGGGGDDIRMIMRNLRPEVRWLLTTCWIQRHRQHTLVLTSSIVAGVQGPRRGLGCLGWACGAEPKEVIA